MRAYSSVSGGVIFVPDEIETKNQAAVSYADIAKAPEKKGIVSLFFGKRKSPEKKVREAA